MMKLVKNHYWLLFGLALGIPIRFYKLHEPQLWLDELLRLVRFSHSSLWENLNDLRLDVAAVPLDYVIQNVLIQVGGLSEFTARFHAAFFGCVSILAIYWLGKTILSSKTGGVAAFLLAVYPLHIFYSKEAANYSLFFLLTICSFLLLWKSLTGSGLRYWVWFSVCTVTNLYTNYFAVALLACQGLLVVLTLCYPRVTGLPLNAHQNRRNFYYYLVSSAISAALFLPWALWTWSSTRADYPSLFSESNLPLRIFKELSGGSYPLSTLMITLAVIGMGGLIGKRRWSELVFLNAWFVLPFLAVLLLDFWRGYFFAIRQILFTTPPLLLLVALGIESLRTRRWFLLSLGLLTLLSIGTIMLSDKKAQADWKGLDQYLHAHVQGDDLIAAPNVERVIAIRYPEIMERRIDLASVLSSQGQVHLVHSRYATHEQQERIVEILQRSVLQRSLSIPGFEIHVLRQSLSD